MNVLNEQSNDTVTAEDIAEQIKSRTQALWTRIVSSHQFGMKQLWEDLPEGINPQDVIDALGVEAGEIFQLSGMLAEFIANIDPEKVISIPENVSYTINGDGTVTLS